MVEKMRERPEMAGTAVVMLTSAGQRGDAARCRSLGIGGYLSKPVRQAELRHAITAVLGRAGSLEQAPKLVTRHSMREQRNALRILLAEDNTINQKLAVHLLEKKGNSVTVVGDGAQAVAESERTVFDLILMDVQMPTMDGLEATAAIREREKCSGRHLPIIAMTACAMSGDRDRCLEAGMDGYVSKPIRMEELNQAIEGLHLGAAELPLEPAVPS